LSLQSIPRSQDQAADAVFTVLPLFLFFEDAEGFAKKIWANFFMNGTHFELKIKSELVEDFD
jgi:hypothetical protein